MFNLKKVLNKLPLARIPSSMDIYVGDVPHDTVVEMVRQRFGGAVTVARGSAEQRHLGRSDAHHATLTRTPTPPGVRFHTEAGPEGPHGRMVLEAPIGWVVLEMVQGPSFEVTAHLADPHDNPTPYDDPPLNNDGEEAWRELAACGYILFDDCPCAMDLFDQDDDTVPTVAAVFKSAGLPPPWVCSAEDSTLLGPWGGAATAS